MRFLEFYSTLTSSLTVEHIMTERTAFEGFAPDTSKSSAFAFLRARDYDQAPVFDSLHEILGFVEMSSLRENDQSPVADSYSKITPSHMISNSVRVVDALHELAECRFLYVIENRRIAGLVTYADCDKRPVRSLLFTLLGEFESRLIRLMGETNSDSDYWMRKLDARRQEYLIGLHQRRKAQNVATSEIECFSMGDIFQAIRDEPAIIARIGFEGQGYAARTERLKTLRDRISHPGLDLIGSFEELKSIMTDKESIFDLLRRLDS